MKSRKLTIALFIFYLLVLTAIVLWKTRLSFRIFGLIFTFVSPDIKRSINLIPLGGMLVLNGRPDYNEIILNALVFIPFGTYLSMLTKNKSFLNLIVPIVLTSLLFEALQYAFFLGASDITDVIANTLGGMIGIGIFFLLTKLCKKYAYAVMNSLALAATIGFALLLSMVRFF